MNMRRILILLLLIIGISGTAYSQAAREVVSYEGLERRLERSDRQIDPGQHNFFDRLFNRHERPQTWLNRADVFFDIYEANIAFIRFGMPVDEFILFFGEPEEKRTKEMERAEWDVYVYPRIKFYFEQDVLVAWDETETVHEDPLPEALSAIEQAIELDEDGRQEDDIEEKLIRLNNNFVNAAINAYEKDDFQESFENFRYSIRVIEMPHYTMQIDTAVYYNTGFLASQIGNHEEALQFYEKAKELNYGGANTYLLIKDSYMALGDTLKAEETLQEGFAEYPQDNALLVEMINFYLESDRGESAMEYLELAIEQEPDNPSYYFAMGALLERQDKSDEALEAYITAHEIDPELFEVNYNLGAFYYNKALDMFDAANEIVDNVEYQKAREEAFDVLEQALPYMEKAHEVNPDDQDTMETLRILYYRLGMEEKYEEMNRKLGHQ